MENVQKLSDLPKEKQILIKKSFYRFVLRNVFTGINLCGLLVLSNVLVTIAQNVYSFTLTSTFTLCVVADVLSFLVARSSMKNHSLRLKKEIKEIIKK